MKRNIEGYRTRLKSPAAAAAYATRFERGSRRRIDQREQQAVRTIFAGLPDCRTILDVPCGAGRFLATLAEGGRAVTEADVAPEILDQGRQRATQLGLHATFLEADASRLPLADACMDAVFSNRLLHHITSAPERAVFLREFHRVSRRFLVVSFFDYQRFGTLRRLLKRLKGRHVTYAGQPTLAEFQREVQACNFRLRAIQPTGPLWVAQKYFVLEKS